MVEPQALQQIPQSRPAGVNPDDLRPAAAAWAEQDGVIMRRWLDSWSGIGHVAEAMPALEYDLRLSRSVFRLDGGLRSGRSEPVATPDRLEPRPESVEGGAARRTRDVAPRILAGRPDHERRANAFSRSRSARNIPKRCAEAISTYAPSGSWVSGLGCRCRFHARIWSLLLEAFIAFGLTRVATTRCLRISTFSPLTVSATLRACLYHARGHAGFPKSWSATPFASATANSYAPTPWPPGTGRNAM
jgi:hypothetical protein